jgi:hypothetical protein
MSPRRGVDVAYIDELIIDPGAIYILLLLPELWESCGLFDDCFNFNSGVLWLKSQTLRS